MAQAMNETKSTDTEKLIAYFEKQAQFDLLKARKGYFRSWDHQLMQEAYPFTVKPKGQAKDKWDILALGAAVPAAERAAGSHQPDQRAEPLHVCKRASDAGACGAAPAAAAAARRRCSSGLSMQFIFLLEQVVNGLVLGGYYLLIALGLSLIFSVGGVVNLAHGAFYALGAYASVEIAKYLGFGPAVVLSPVAVALLGILFERFILRRFYTADPILSLLVTFGLAHGRRAGDPHDLGRGAAAGLDAAGVQGRGHRSATSCSRATGCCCSPWSPLVLLGVWLLLHKTSFGRVVRAGIQRPDMVAALGIRLQPYMTAIVMLGVGMAALGGALFAPITHRASGDGRRDHHRRLRRGRDRRARQLLGRGARRAAGRRGARHHHPFRAGGRRSVDLRADVPGAAVPAARPARRAHREVRMSDRRAVMRNTGRC